MSAPHATTELPINDALQYAIRLHRESMFDGAETLYRRILDVVPENANVIHFLGVLLHQRGKTEESLAFLRNAIALVPDFADFHVNLGNVLAESGDMDAAEREYVKAIELAPQRADVFNNLGVIHKARNQYPEAEAAFRYAIELDPRHINAHNNMGLLYAAKGCIKEAVHYYCQSITLMPDNPNGRRLLGTAYYTMGKIPEAAEVFRQWLEEEPENPVAKHMFAACSGKDVPDRAPDDYIEHTFDRFANSFDEQLQEKLSYQAPQLVANALSRHVAAPDKQFDVLDAGCGTGLCGPLIAPYARRLVGVDLSGAMLAKAEGKGCYQALKKAELTAFIEAHPNAFDVIVSADTLVYFGALERVFAAVRKALRPGGCFVFSVEDGEGYASEGEFVLRPCGRYAHTREYVERVAGEAGLKGLGMERVVLRTEGGVGVQGWVGCLLHIYVDRRYKLYNSSCKRWSDDSHLLEH